MSYQTFTIDGNNFSDIDEFYNELMDVMSLPEWFGRNMSAFNDVLCGGCGPTVPYREPYKIRWINFKNDHLSKDLLDVFLDHTDQITLEISG